MKRFVFSILLVSLAFTLFAQDSEERELPFFDKLRVTNQIKVYLSYGNESKARVVVSGVNLDDIITEVNAKTLEVSFGRGLYKDYSAEVYLTYKELRNIHVSASGSVSLQNDLAGDKVVLSASTNGTIDASVNLRTSDIVVSKGGAVRLDGKLGSFEAKVNTAGTLTASDLIADSVFVTVRSKGLAKIAAKELLEADVRTGGTLSLTGKPNNKTIKTGFGAIVHEN
ncbi:MAG: head GIN domain-containing protein [Bacteroidales bacterium]